MSYWMQKFTKILFFTSSIICNIRFGPPSLRMAKRTTIEWSVHFWCLWDICKCYSLCVMSWLINGQQSELGNHWSLAWGPQAHPKTINFPLYSHDVFKNIYVTTNSDQTFSFALHALQCYFIASKIWPDFTEHQFKSVFSSWLLRLFILFLQRTFGLKL